jgi:hypothetical protein
MLLHACHKTTGRISGGRNATNLPVNSYFSKTSLALVTYIGVRCDLPTECLPHFIDRVKGVKQTVKHMQEFACQRVKSRNEIFGPPSLGRN